MLTTAESTAAAEPTLPHPNTQSNDVGNEDKVLLNFQELENICVTSAEQVPASCVLFDYTINQKVVDVIAQDKLTAPSSAFGNKEISKHVHCRPSTSLQQCVHVIS